MRTRMTRTSRPADRARSWKPRSPSGLRRLSALADPAGVAGSAFVTVLMTVRSPELRESCAQPYEVILLSCATAAESMLDGSGDKLSGVRSAWPVELSR